MGKWFPELRASYNVLWLLGYLANDFLLFHVLSICSFVPNWEEWLVVDIPEWLQHDFKYTELCWIRDLNVTKEVLLFSLGVYISDLIVFQNLLWWEKSGTAGGFMMGEFKWFVIQFYFSFCFGFFSFFFLKSCIPFSFLLLLLLFLCMGLRMQIDFLSPSCAGFSWQVFKVTTLLGLRSLKVPCLVAFLSPATLLLRPDPKVLNPISLLSGCLHLFYLQIRQSFWIWMKHG